ncbi:lamin-A-like [Thunnus maccoyii]|uniref:lamin-A-like n=1 Tax=Thunnus maccoyii TaxID=8240 RepID=UPI001C4B4244|nr:lamin-A-like [Thunnus maccoyii]
MMLCQTDRLPFKSHLRALSVLVFHILLIHFCRGQSQLIGSSQPIVATLGDDIIFPCHLQPAVDAAGLTLEWTRPDLDPRFVHVWRDGVELVSKKHKSFAGRTSLFTDELKNGNISLKLSKVQLSDHGTYRCFIPTLEKQSFVQLVVASDAVSSSVVILAGADRDREKVVLQCESKGWYPEPEVFWLDGEGNLLSAGPTETVRGPDDLYTVSSRVTVEKRHNNNFTCRVQQSNTKQTREINIYIPDDFFMFPCNSAVPINIGLAVSLAVCIVFIFAVVSFVWRQNIIKRKRSNMDKTERGLNENDIEVKVLTAKGTEGEQLMPTTTLSENKNRKTEKKNKKTKCVVQLHSHVLTKSCPAFLMLIFSLFQFSKRKSKRQLQEEQQRREEAENRVETMKQELETMKKKVENKHIELQQLHEEHQRKEGDLQTLKEKLETKNKESMRIRNSQSRFSWGSNKLEQQRMEEAQKEVQKLKEEQETKEMELKATIKKIEEKKAEVQELCDDNQRRETNLQSLMGELETNSTERQLQDEQQRREKELETKMNEQFEELRKTQEQLKNTSAELRILEKELEKSKLKVLGLQNSQKQSQEGVYTSAASQGSVRGRVYVEEVDLDGKNVHLTNMSHEDQPLGCWELQIQVDNKQLIIYTFLPSFTLKAGKTVTIWPSSSDVAHSPPTDLVLWKSWGPANELLVTLVCCSGEVMAKTKVKNTKDVNCAH